MAAPGPSARVLRSMVLGSQVVGLLSALVGAVAAIWRALGRSNPGFARRIAPPVGWGRLGELGAGSVVVRRAARGGAALGRAWATAASVTRARQVWTGCRALPLPALIRLAGVVALAALSTHLGLVAVTPEHLRPAMPISAAGFVLLCALLMVGANHSIARAWETWTRR